MHGYWLIGQSGAIAAYVGGGHRSWNIDQSRDGSMVPESGGETKPVQTTADAALRNEPTSEVGENIGCLAAPAASLCTSLGRWLQLQRNLTRFNAADKPKGYYMCLHCCSVEFGEVHTEEYVYC